MNIRDKRLIFDGGMGTYFAEKTKQIGAGCELANLSDESLIRQIHKEYIDAGCTAIKTNTFSVNRVAMMGDDELVEKIIKSGWRLATDAVAASNKDVAVFADIGPITDEGHLLDLYEEYRFVVDIFLSLGATNFIFETFASADRLDEIAAYIKDKNPEAYIIASFAVLPDGFSRDGIHIADLSEAVDASKDIDVFGLNCMCGAKHMLLLLDEVNSDKPLAMMPNAGYPIVVNNRTYYDGDANYFATQIIEMSRRGVKILGGCCGTTPEHIKMVSEGIGHESATIANKDTVTEQKLAAIPDEKEDTVISKFWEKLSSGKKVIAVEIDPPANASYEKFMGGAWEIKASGADIITIADCPIARARMDSSLLACKLRRELGIDVLPHMTCRDRNLNATKALLLGLYAEGIRNVLLITGDPIPSAERDEVKSVYQFNSRKFANYVKSLAKTSLPGEFNIFGALNVNARNFDVQLEIAKKKIESGMVGFLTQPVLTDQALENIKRARKELDVYILGGVIPIVSEKNGRYMDSEINGISVDENLIERYVGKTRAESEDIAVEISTDIMKKIEDYVDGFYLMTPFGRTGLIARIIESFNEK